MATFTQGDVGTTYQLDANANLTGATVVAHIRREADATVFNKTPAVTDAANGVCVITWAAPDLTTVGRHTCELQVTFSGGAIQTFGPTVFYVQPQLA